MKRIFQIIILAVAMGFAVPASAQDCDSLFEAANSLYTAGDYDSSLTIYNMIVGQEYESSTLYYNMGNTYFKKRNYPKSILYYEKALKLNPNDQDARNNLAIANTFIIDKIEPLPEVFLKRWWRSVRNSMPADTWATLSIIAFALTLVCLGFVLKSHSGAVRKTGFFAGIVVFVLLIITANISISKTRYLKTRNEAIIMTPTITVKSSPSANSIDLFVLHEGSRVSIVDKTGEWNNIRIANGSSGWLPDSSMEKF